MIKLFGKTDKTFASNGDLILKPMKAKVRKEDNGDFYIDIETDLSCVDDLTEGRIIVAPTPQGEQAFRISNIEKAKHKIIIKAWHVFYDSENYIIADSYVVDKNCNDALDHLNSATDTESPFTTISDITMVNTYRCVRTSLYEAINTVLERWGGHIVRDNFTIGIRQNIGQDNGVTVQYKKNLKDITSETVFDNVVTKLMPVGKDGLLLNYVDETEDIYVYSETQYDIPYTKVISFSQDHIESEEYDDEESYISALLTDLRQQAVQYVAEHCIPEVNYTLKANLEKVTDIGDTVQVNDSRIGIDVLTHVISYEYDCILGRYTEIEFGNFKKTLSSLVSDITSNAQQVAKEESNTVKITLSDELKQATSKIWNILGDSYVIYNGDSIMVVDKLPKETATNVMMINAGGIGFSQTGINGTFSSAWTIDGTMDMQSINVINMTADLIKGGTLKLGSKTNQSGIIELYDEANNLIGLMDKNGLKMYGLDGSYVLMNNDVGFAGYDRRGNKIYWVSQDEFHMKKSVIEEEITLCNQLRFIPIQIKDSEGNIVNEGIGLVSSRGE